MKEHLNPVRLETVAEIAPATLHSLYTTMLKIRLFEERVARLLVQGEIRCPTHLCIGQEAVAAGVCANLRKDDLVYSTHRGHGHYIAKGGDLNLLMAELYGRKTGCSRGKGGSMHVVAPETGFMGSSSIVGGNIPLAVGAALAFTMQKSDRVSVAFFGDGATDEGVFHESLNFAALKGLPVLFVCENNLYSSHLRLSERQPADNIYKQAEVHKVPGIRIDGNNVVEVYLASQKAIEKARKGRGPTLMECRTFRWRGHVGPSWDLDKDIRDPEEVEVWVRRCPIKMFEALLVNSGILTDSDNAKLCNKIDEEVEKALAFAKDSPYPEESELLQNLFKGEI